MHLALLSVAPSLLLAGPRFVEPTSACAPVFIFIDGACGEDSSSIGAVMFCPGRRPEAFGLKLSEYAISQMISKVSQKQIIGQAELLPVLVAKLVWMSTIANRRVFYFLDNDSARIA